MLTNDLCFPQCSYTPSNSNISQKSIRINADDQLMSKLYHIDDSTCTSSFKASQPNEAAVFPITFQSSDENAAHTWMHTWLSSTSTIHNNLRNMSNFGAHLPANSLSSSGLTASEFNKCYALLSSTEGISTLPYVSNAFQNSGGTYGSNASSNPNFTQILSNFSNSVVSEVSSTEMFVTAKKSGKNDEGKGKSKKPRNRYKHIPHREKPKPVVARRNARERRRVQTVNGAFSLLRKHIPYESKHKRLSKVKTLRIAINYIQQLQQMLQRSGAAEVGDSCQWLLPSRYFDCKPTNTAILTDSSSVSSFESDITLASPSCHVMALSKTCWLTETFE